MKCDYNNLKPRMGLGCYIIGPTGPTGSTGPMGPQGIPGETGPEGLPSAKVTVGKTSTSPPGSEALVSNSGTENNVILDFVIPRGVPGPPPNFIIGNVVTGEAGSKAEVTITPINKNTN